MTPEDRAPTTGARRGAVSAQRRRDRSSTSRQLRLWVPWFFVSYGLMLFMLSDDWFLLAMPGILGMATIGWVVGTAIMNGNTPVSVPYATDGTDVRGPVAYHRILSTKRFAAAVGFFALVVTLVVTVKSDYLVPLAPLGVVVLILGTRQWASSMFSLTQCARVMKEYRFAYCSRVKVLHRTGNSKQLFRIGAGTETSPKLVGEQIGGDADWPARVGAGAWFAGDELFGGVLLVPGSGELVWASPNDPPALYSERMAASGERKSRAKRAGIGKSLK